MKIHAFGLGSLLRKKINYLKNHNPFKVLGFLFRGKSKEKRILGIWDFEINQIVLGSFCEFQNSLLAMTHLHGTDKIDIAFIFNPTDPITNPKFSSWVNASNFNYHFADMLPLLNANPKLCSVFLFDSRADFERFFLENSDRYYSFPSINDFVNRNPACTGNFRFVSDFYLQNKIVPTLKLKKITSVWAANFIRKHAKNNLSISVNLRYNPFYSLHRNSDLDAWNDFFEYCLKNKPNATFVILGRKDELEGRIKKFPNLVFSKDYDTNAEQDLALMRYSFFHMGATSGLASFAFLSADMPYFVVRFRMDEKGHEYNESRPTVVFPWQDTKFQRLLWESETKEILIDGFEYMLTVVDEKKWRDNLDVLYSDIGILKWPYLDKK